MKNLLVNAVLLFLVAQVDQLNYQTKAFTIKTKRKEKEVELYYYKSKTSRNKLLGQFKECYLMLLE